MKYIVTFSGGKDSLATIIWAKENLPPFRVIGSRRALWIYYSGNISTNVF